MSNFFLFEVYKESEKFIPFDNIKTDGFRKIMLVQGGDKLNCMGAGSVKFEVNKLDTANPTGDIKVFFEASSKEELPKDTEGYGYDRKKRDIDLIVGNVVGRDDNKNSFYMTGETEFPLELTVYVDGIKVDDISLPNNPADSRGCLSWHYQAHNNLLDEAG